MFTWLLIVTILSITQYVRVNGNHYVLPDELRIERDRLPFSQWTPFQNLIDPAVIYDFNGNRITDGQIRQRLNPSYRTNFDAARRPNYPRFGLFPDPELKPKSIDRSSYNRLDLSKGRQNIEAAKRIPFTHYYNPPNKARISSNPAFSNRNRTLYKPRRPKYFKDLPDHWTNSREKLIDEKRQHNHKEDHDQAPHDEEENTQDREENTKDSEENTDDREENTDDRQENTDDREENTDDREENTHEPEENNESDESEKHSKQEVGDDEKYDNNEDFVPSEDGVRYDENHEEKDREGESSEENEPEEEEQTEENAREEKTSPKPIEPSESEAESTGKDQESDIPLVTIHTG